MQQSLPLDVPDRRPEDLVSFTIPDSVITACRQLGISSRSPRFKELHRLFESDKARFEQAVNGLITLKSNPPLFGRPRSFNRAFVSYVRCEA
ncbi:MAG TPA: hypothetical protein VLA04_06205 [Verrucomicrobiae bacterium]|nr:hypothetical protein [Verrucomicrobiae bacterium]